jgi:hypothetical protein
MVGGVGFVAFYFSAESNPTPDFSGFQTSKIVGIPSEVP